MKAEEYFKEWGKVCRFVKWKLGDQVHTHRTMLEFAEAYANEERERILGIIEHRAAHYRHKKRSTPFAGYRQVLIEREVELKVRYFD